MDYYYFTFRSITRGQLALRYLQAADITATLLRTPKVLATEGCGYAIRVRATDRTAVDTIFAQNDIQFQRRFFYHHGQFREARGGLS